MRYTALIFTMFLARPSYAQLLRLPHYGGKPIREDALRIETAGEVPADLKGDVQLTYKRRSGVFDGGSRIATFSREDGSELELFFANPAYWTDEAKQKSLAPVAILRDNYTGVRASLTEIVHKSACEKRICQLLAVSLATGKYTPTSALELIELRDCLLTRVPLASLARRFDPQAGWKERPKR